MSLRCSVFGIPSAVVSWWRGERLVANNSRLVHEWEEQFYRVVEHRANTHQVSGNEGTLSQYSLQGSASKCRAQGCVNAADKASQEVISIIHTPNLWHAF